jgi:hypothetical protein
MSSLPLLHSCGSNVNYALLEAAFVFPFAPHSISLPSSHITSHHHICQPSLPSLFFSSTGPANFPCLCNILGTNPPLPSLNLPFLSFSQREAETRQNEGKCRTSTSIMQSNAFPLVLASSKMYCLQEAWLLHDFDNVL